MNNLLLSFLKYARHSAAQFNTDYAIWSKSASNFNVPFLRSWTSFYVTILNCTIQGHLEQLQSCAIITSNSSIFSSPQEETQPH